jgi:hypothetical protein
MIQKAGINQHRARGDLRIVAVEPTSTQRKDSVLRRDMTGSVLTFYSVTYVHKLINIVEPWNCGAPKAAQTHPAAISLPIRPFRPLYRRMPIGRKWKDQVESLRTAWIADFRV